MMRRAGGLFLLTMVFLATVIPAFAGEGPSTPRKRKQKPPQAFFQEGSDNAGDSSDSAGDGVEKVDINALKKKFKGKDLGSALDALKKGGLDGLEGGKKTGAGDKTPDGKPAGPLSIADMQQTDDGPLSENDKAYVKAHWINAKRNYKKKNLERALEEISNILNVDKKHGESYLMRASISAMKKTYLDAWRDLEKAKKLLPGDAKVTKFEATLQKTSPKPDSIPEEGGAVNRPQPTFASQAMVDALENLFADRASVGKVSGLNGTSPSEADGKVAFPISFTGNEKLDSDVLEKKMKEAAHGEVKDTKAKNDGKSVDMTVSLSGLPAKNPAPQPLKDIGEFMKIISDETDVKIDNANEGNIEPEKIVTGTYTLLARSLSEINTFLRKLSPHTESYFLEKMELTSINNTVVWKSTAKVRIKTE